MNLKTKTMIQKVLALHTLRSLNKDSALSNFSWARVKYNLLNISSANNAEYTGDDLVLNFIMHQHSIILGKEGYGVLYNPWKPSSQKYTLMMPFDIQELVIALWEVNRAPIPINMSRN